MRPQRPKESFDLVYSGKLPPQNVELEMIILGGLLLDKRAVPTVANILREDSFYREENKLIYDSIIRLFSEQRSVDIMTVTADLKKAGKLETVGGALYIANLTNRIASTANIEEHAIIVEQQAIKRRIIKISSSAIKECYDDTTDPLSVLNDLYAGTTSKGMIFSSSNPEPKTRMDKAFQVIKNAQLGIRPGITTGDSALDLKIGGWQPGELYIIAGRPGMGKTAFALSSAKAAEKKANVFWLQLEMSDEQIGLREISFETELTVEQLKSGKLNSSQEALLRECIERIKKEKRLFIDTDPDANIIKITSKCIRAIHEHNAKLLIIDYLGLIDIDHRPGENTSYAIGRVTRALKLLAKKAHVPIILLAQLGRAVESTADKRPSLKDLRDSGAIEQDADNVLFLYRPEYYGFKSFNVNGEEGSSEGIAEIIIAKNRQGKLGSVYSQCKIQYNHFGDIATKSYVDFGDRNNISPNPKAIDKIENYNGDNPF